MLATEICFAMRKKDSGKAGKVGLNKCPLGHDSPFTMLSFILFIILFKYHKGWNTESTQINFLFFSLCYFFTTKDGLSPPPLPCSQELCKLISLNWFYVEDRMPALLLCMILSSLKSQKKHTQKSATGANEKFFPKLYK